MDDDILPLEVGDLSPRREAFAVAYARIGVAWKAAVEAGYSPDSARVTGPRLLRDAAILARVRQEQAQVLAEQRARLSAMATAALDSLEKSIGETQPGSMARVRACEVVLDRAGHRPVEQVQAAVGVRDLDGMTEDEARQIVEDAKARLGFGVFIVPPQAPSIEAWAANPTGEIVTE